MLMLRISAIWTLALVKLFYVTFKKSVSLIKV